MVKHVRVVAERACDAGAPSGRRRPNGSAQIFDRKRFFPPPESCANLRNASPCPSQAGRRSAIAATSLPAGAGRSTSPALLILCTIPAPHPIERSLSSAPPWRRLFRIFTPDRGACGAPMALGCVRGTRLGMPYTLTQDARERACDRHADASLDRHRPPRPPCDHCAPRASPACDRFPQTGQARLFFAHRAGPTCVR
jgi:hypothetical protein